MKGQLKNKEGKWFVEYWYIRTSSHATHPNQTELPLHPDSIKNILPKYIDIGQNPHKEYFYEGEVEFEIVDGESWTDAPYGAKLITKQEESSNWDEIKYKWLGFEENKKHYISKEEEQLFNWLKEHYLPPVKK